MGPVTAHIAGRLAPHCGAFLGGTFTPGTPINSPVAMKKKKKKRKRERNIQSADQEDEDKTEIGERELNSSASSLRTSCPLPTFSLRVLVDRAVLLLLPAKEKIPDDPDSHPVNGEQDSLSTAT